MWEDKGFVAPLPFWLTPSVSFCPSAVHLLFNMCIYCHIYHTELQRQSLLLPFNSTAAIFHVYLLSHLAHYVLSFPARVCFHHSEVSRLLFWASSTKNPPVMQETPSSIPGSGGSPREGVGYPLQYSWASLVAQTVKNPPTRLSDWTTTTTKVCGGFPSSLCPCNKLDKCCSALKFTQTVWRSYVNENFDSLHLEWLLRICIPKKFLGCCRGYGSRNHTKKGGSKGLYCSAYLRGNSFISEGPFGNQIINPLIYLFCKFIF